jgi:hypothetical protein
MEREQHYSCPAILPRIRMFARVARSVPSMSVDRSCSLARPRPSVHVAPKLPDLPGGQHHPCWAKINQFRIPHRSKYISPPRLDVHCYRGRLDITYVWHLAHGQDMLPGWQPCVIVATLDNVRNGPPVDLKIESQIPSKVRRPENHQMPTRSGSSGSNRNRANESKNQEEPAVGVVF